MRYEWFRSNLFLFPLCFVPSPLIRFNIFRKINCKSYKVDDVKSGIIDRMNAGGEKRIKKMKVMAKSRQVDSANMRILWWNGWNGCLWCIRSHVRLLHFFFLLRSLETPDGIGCRRWIKVGTKANWQIV